MARQPRKVTHRVTAHTYQQSRFGHMPAVRLEDGSLWAMKGQLTATLEEAIRIAREQAPETIALPAREWECLT